MNFTLWLFVESVLARIRSRKETSPKNAANTFLVVYGADKDERDLIFARKEDLKRLGFSYYRGNGTWSLFSPKLTPEVRAKLEDMGVDLSGYDNPPAPVEDPIAQAPEEPSKSDETLEQMHAELEKAKTSDEKASRLINSIEKMIEKVANSTDEAAKQSFIRNFLDFSARFYNYSLNNQMLIWVQTAGKARHVAGERDWANKFGREVADRSKAISILGHPKDIKKDSEGPDGEEKKTTSFRWFPTVKVYDVTATRPIPGHPNSFQPITRKDWSKDSNEDIEEIKRYIDALDNWAKENGIEKGFEEMDPEKGGYSAGGRIAINSAFKGINMFSTYVHEVAHEILHWKDEELKTKSTSQQKEIDAETTAYIVLKHFGFETQDTSNYLALWRATGKDIMARKTNIQKAAKEIINGIKGKLGESDEEGDDEDVPPVS